MLSVVKGKMLGWLQSRVLPTASLPLLFPPSRFLLSPLNQDLDVLPRLLDDPHGLLHRRRPDVVDGEEYYMYLDGAQGNEKPLAAQLMSPGGSSASEDCFIFYYIFKVRLGLMINILTIRSSERRRYYLTQDRDGGSVWSLRDCLVSGER